MSHCSEKCNCQTLPDEIAEAFPNYPATPLQTTTQWAVQPEQILSYPCSKGYLNNGEANYELDVDISMNRAHASHFHTGRGPLSPAPVVTLPTRPRSRSLSLLLFPYYQYQRAHLI